jgi:predicted lipoprotein
MRATHLPMALVLFLGHACTPSGPGDANSVKALGQLAAEAVSLHQELAVEAKGLATAGRKLAIDPSSLNVEQARAAWKATRAALRRIDALAFGPRETLRSTDALDFWPPNEKTLEMRLAGTESVDASAVAAVGANLKGLASLEYLLFDGEAAATAAKLSDSRRRQWLEALAAAVDAECARLATAWEAFAVTLSTPGPTNADFPSSKAAIDAVVNQSYFEGDFVANTLVGRPLGLRNNGVVDAASERAARSGHSIAEIRASIEGMKRIYDFGLETVVSPRNPTLAGRVSDAYVSALEKLSQVPEPLSSALVDSKPSVQALHQALRELKNIYGAELATALGVTLRFSDNDGD